MWGSCYKSRRNILCRGIRVIFIKHLNWKTPRNVFNLKFDRPFKRTLWIVTHWSRSAHVCLHFCRLSMSLRSSSTRNALTTIWRPLTAKATRQPSWADSVAVRPRSLWSPLVTRCTSASFLMPRCKGRVSRPPTLQVCVNAGVQLSIFAITNATFSACMCNAGWVCVTEKVPLTTTGLESVFPFSSMTSFVEWYFPLVAHHSICVIKIIHETTSVPCEIIPQKCSKKSTTSSRNVETPTFYCFHITLTSPSSVSFKSVEVVWKQRLIRRTFTPMPSSETTITQVTRTASGCWPQKRATASSSAS